MGSSSSPSKCLFVCVFSSLYNTHTHTHTKATFSAKSSSLRTAKRGKGKEEEEKPIIVNVSAKSLSRDFTEHASNRKKIVAADAVSNRQ